MAMLLAMIATSAEVRAGLKWKTLGKGSCLSGMPRRRKLACTKKWLERWGCRWKLSKKMPSLVETMVTLKLVEGDSVDNQPLSGHGGTSLVARGGPETCRQ